MNLQVTMSGKYSRLQGQVRCEHVFSLKILSSEFLGLAYYQSSVGENTLCAPTRQA
jgi:hypothetical protein